MENIININPENKIAESTKLIREIFDYVITKRQLDIIYAIISLVSPDDEEFKEYKVEYKVFAKIFNPANPNCQITQNDVEKALDLIMKSYFKIHTDEIDYHYHWVEKAENHKKEKYVNFRLNKDVQKFYLQLKSGECTIYLLKDLLALSTLFQANLFRWLACNSGFNNKVRISIEDAKKIFYGKDIETKTFIRKIDSALKKVNEVTNIKASYNKNKSGKNIIELEFIINNKYRKESKSLKISNKEKSKAMWQELLELKKENEKLKEMLNKT